VLSARPQGFTLIELMVAVGLLALLFMLGLPNLATWLQNSQIRTAADSMLNGLQLARTEAVRRNARVRFQLTSTAGAGLSDWSLNASDDGGATYTVPIQTRSSAEGSTGARIGVSAVVTPPAYTVALGPGAGLPASVIFNPVGRAETEAGVTRIVRVDVTNPALAAADARRLVLVVAAGGQIRMCDPRLALSANPQGCE